MVEVAGTTYADIIDIF